jgi:hypothetical protein
VKFVDKSDADFVILGGDFNVDPKVRRKMLQIKYLFQVNANETTYADIKTIMTNSIEEFFKKIEVSK